VGLRLLLSLLAIIETVSVLDPFFISVINLYNYGVLASLIVQPKFIKLFLAVNPSTPKGVLFKAPNSRSAQEFIPSAC